MKNFNFSLIALATLGSVSVLGANDLAEALIKGKVSADIGITYESRHFDHEIPSSYDQNTAYSVGSLGLGYETGKYYGFSVNAAFRGYKNIWEDDDDSTTWTGKGDASERFYETGKNGDIDLERLYLGYDNDFLHIKAGRQYIYTDWLTKVFDGVRVQANFNNNTTEIDTIWVNRRGKVETREYIPLEEVNDDNGGAYELSVAQKFSENFKAKLYALTAHDSHDIYGGKLNVDFTSGDVSYGGLVHYMQTNEDELEDDGSMIETQLYAGMSGYTLTFGFVKTGEDTGWGSAANYGDIVVPFEEGDGMYAVDVTTFYAMLSKYFDKFYITALVGNMNYKAEKGGEDYDEVEFDLWAGYSFTEHLALDIGYTYAKDQYTYDSPTTADMNQFNATLVYKF